MAKLTQHLERKTLWIRALHNHFIKGTESSENTMISTLEQFTQDEILGNDKSLQELLALVLLKLADDQEQLKNLNEQIANVTGDQNMNVESISTSFGITAVKRMLLGLKENKTLSVVEEETIKLYMNNFLAILLVLWVKSGEIWDEQLAIARKTLDPEQDLKN